jgi:hypothetical protein
MNEFPVIKNGALLLINEESFVSFQLFSNERLPTNPIFIVHIGASLIKQITTFAYWWLVHWIIAMNTIIYR